jgi:hypothetical protein
VFGMLNIGKSFLLFLLVPPLTGNRGWYTPIGRLLE